MTKFAITGNIASGKTVAYEIIKNQGYSIIDCDDIVKELYGNEHFISLISQKFPQIVNSMFIVLLWPVLILCMHVPDHYHS